MAAAHSAIRSSRAVSSRSAERKRTIRRRLASISGTFVVIRVSFGSRQCRASDTFLGNVVDSTRCLASSLFLLLLCSVLRFAFPEGIFRILKLAFFANARITYIEFKGTGCCLGYYTLEFYAFAEFPVRRYVAEHYFLKRYPLEYRSLERSSPQGIIPRVPFPRNTALQMSILRNAIVWNVPGILCKSRSSLQIGVSFNVYFRGFLPSSLPAASSCIAERDHAFVIISDSRAGRGALLEGSSFRRSHPIGNMPEEQHPRD